MSDKDHDFGSLVCIYSQILPRIRLAAKEMGYAIAIHGTLQRDFDLLAVPWTDEAVEPVVLVKMIADTVGGYVIGDRVDGRGYISDHPTDQPHGRMSWNICWGGKAFIDLSVMPRSNDNSLQDRLAEVEARCYGCGVLTKPAIYFTPEDHVPIRVNGCLSPTYEQIERRLAEVEAALTQSRNETKGAEYDAGLERAKVAELEGNLADAQQCIDELRAGGDRS